MPYIDLTQPFTPSMPTFPGDPSPKLEQYASIENDGFTDHKLETGMHVGTHIDAPLHMIEEGKMVNDLPIDRFIGTGKLLDARGKKEVDGSVFEGVSVLPGDIVLVYTGWSENFGSKNYYTDYPVLTEDFAETAMSFGAKIVGLDTPSPDRDPYTVHKMLFAKEILIIENLTNLSELVGVEDFDVYALPIKLQADAAPVRVIAQVF